MVWVRLMRAKNIKDGLKFKTNPVTNKPLGQIIKPEYQ